MAEQISVTYRNRGGRPLFAVILQPYDFNDFKLAGRNNDDENDGIFWEAYFSFPFFDVEDYPEIDRIVDEVFEELHKGEDPEELMSYLGTVILNIPELKHKYVPDFLIRNNEIDWKRINKITRGADPPRLWNKLILRLEAELPRPSIISPDHHAYIFHNCCSLIEEYVANGDLVLNSLPNTCELVFNAVGIKNHDILLDIYCKTDVYYAVCTPDGLIHAYAICDKHKNVKALCLI